MLKSLHISNYALIDKIDIQFHRGLNIITGETGGGKSIMLGALSLLLGERADLRSVRNKESKSVIEAEFEVKTTDAITVFFEKNDIDFDGVSLILRREITPAGRSRSFINDTPVTLDLLREMGLKLVDIHSQHQNQLLSSPEFQLKIIDSLAENDLLLKEYARIFNDYKAAIHKFKAIKIAIAKDRENADFMQYQLQRFDELDLQPGELASLEAEREQLTAAAETREWFNEALTALSDAESGALALIESASSAIDNLAETLPEDARIKERLEIICTELSDITDSLEQVASDYPADSSENLDQIDRRISRINDVMCRQCVATEDELIVVADRLRAKLQRLEDSAIILKELEQVARQGKKLAIEKAAEITGRRQNAASEFASVLQATAMPLGMKNLVCDIAVEPSELSADGADSVEFRFAFNKNQTPVPVGVAASGGEISRIMLSVKSIIAHRMALPTIIFDEIDTGVSGDVADRMGRMMLDIASDIQVITITHLPQVAAKGHHHFKVFKRDTETSTVTNVKSLTEPERIDEIALMLSGDSSNSASRAAATELINNSPR